MHSIRFWLLELINSRLCRQVMKKLLDLNSILSDNALVSNWLSGKLERTAAFEQCKTMCAQIEALFAAADSIAWYSMTLTHFQVLCIEHTNYNSVGSIHLDGM